MISFGIAILPTSCRSAPNSTRRRCFGVEVEVGGDLDRELGDAADVDPGVGVVVLDHLAEHPGGAAVGLAQLDHRAHALVALVREQPEQREQRPAQGHGRGLGRRRERDREADRREQRVDQVDPRALGELLAQRGALMEPLARPRGDRVGDELRRQRRDQDQRRYVAGGRAPGRDQDHGRPDREPGVGERVEQARRAAARRGRRRCPGGEQGRGDQQRRGGGRDHEQRRDEGELDRHRVAGADLEHDPGAEHQTDEDQERVGGVHRARLGDRKGDRGDREGAPDDELVDQLATLEMALGALARDRQQPVELRTFLRCGTQSHRRASNSPSTGSSTRFSEVFALERRFPAKSVWLRQILERFLEQVRERRRRRRR